MWKYIKPIIIFGLGILFLGVFASCSRSKKQTYSYNPLGYYYRLISFQQDSFPYQAKQVAWIRASFANQADSIFWDSYNNLNDQFFMEIDSSEKSNFLKNAISLLAPMDSACLLIKTTDFYKQQFKKNQIPFFSKNDSMVKVNVTIKQIYTAAQFLALKNDLQDREKNQIETYLNANNQFAITYDSAGFYWIQKPHNYPLQEIEVGDLISISYQGSFLNGRFLEKSPTKFEFIYGTPDQVIKGLNYVIKYLKEGQNAKIILSSRLAFGENGNSTQSVPPFTPLVYEIKIIDLKKHVKEVSPIPLK